LREADSTKPSIKPTELLPDLIVMDFKHAHSDGLSAAGKILQVTPSVAGHMFRVKTIIGSGPQSDRSSLRDWKRDGVPTLIAR